MLQIDRFEGSWLLDFILLHFWRLLVKFPDVKNYFKTLGLVQQSTWISHQDIALDLMRHNLILGKVRPQAYWALTSPSTWKCENLWVNEIKILPFAYFIGLKRALNKVLDGSVRYDTTPTYSASIKMSQIRHKSSKMRNAQRKTTAKSFAPTFCGELPVVAKLYSQLVFF